MTDWIRDARVGLRTIFARPAFAVVAVLTLGIGIGANTAIYSFVQAVVLRPLPFPEPDRLVRIWETAQREELELRSLSYPMVADLMGATDVFETVAARRQVAVNLGAAAEPQRIAGEAVTPSYFDVFGLSALRGRLFDQTDEDLVVVLSEPLWRERFGGGDVVGKNVLVNEVNVTIVGVASGPGLSGDVDLFLPLEKAPAIVARIGQSRFERRGSRWLSAVGRLRDGVSHEALDAWLVAETSRLQSDFPDVMENRGVIAVPLRDQLLGDVQRTAVMLMISVGLVMLIVCANLAGLLLARGIDREREVALRLAVGASRGHVVRQFLIESLILALLGGGVGIVLALWSSDLLRGTSLFERIPSYVQLGIDADTLFFAVALSVATALVFGVLPALAAAGLELSPALRGRTGGARSGFTSKRGLLVSLQVALALLLTAGSGLMIRSLSNQLRIEPGFRTSSLHTFRIQLPAERYGRDASASFAARLEERLLGLSGVRSAAIGSDVPLVDGYSALTLRVEDWVREGRDDSVRAYHHEVSPGFVSTLSIALETGRDLSAFDGGDAPLVALVSAKLAIRAWPGADPLGKRVSIDGPEGPWREVVGVVSDIRYRDLVSDPVASPDDPDVYFPLAQLPSRSIGIVVDAAGAGPSLAEIRRELRALDPAIPIFEAQSMDDVLASELALPRLAAWLLSSFGVVAVFLAALGLYGVLAHLVAERSREIGIRVALGASAYRVVRGVVAPGLAFVGLGLFVGLVAALVAGRFIENRLFDVSGTDPWTLAVSSVMLGAVALVATLVPARRASQVDPMTVLRQD